MQMNNLGATCTVRTFRSHDKTSIISILLLYKEKQNALLKNSVFLSTLQHQKRGMVFISGTF